MKKWNPAATLGTDLSTIQLRIVRGPSGLEWQVWGPQIADAENPDRVRCLQNGLLSDCHASFEYPWPRRQLETLFSLHEAQAREIGWIR